MSFYMFLASSSLLAIPVRRTIIRYIDAILNRNNSIVETAGKLSKKQMSKSGNR